MPSSIATDTSPLALSYTHGTTPLTSTSTTEHLKTYLHGYPISYSFAPLLHNTAFSQLSLPWSYTLHENPAVDSFLPLLKSPSTIGAAVTMPHKLAFLPYVDELTEEGRMVGAINTIFIRLDPTTKKSKYIGTNTDTIGVQEAFLQNYPDILEKSSGRPGLVLGGGGATRSSVWALHKGLRCSKIYLVNRLKSEVDAVINGFREAGFEGELVHVETVEQAKALETPAVMVGCVPDIPPRTQEELQARALMMEFLSRPEKGVILEMCYNPPVTELWRLCEENRWKVIPGVEAMIYQGIAQDVLWIEKELPEELVKKVSLVVRTRLAEKLKADAERLKSKA